LRSSSSASCTAVVFVHCSENHSGPRGTVL